MIEKLKKLYSYNKETGKFVRLTSRGGNKIGSEAGRLMNNGYIFIGIDGKEYGAHRLAWLLEYGKFPLYEIDHKDRNRSNNAISNLREVTSSENNLNRKIFKNNTSGCKGVSFTSNRWRASISINGEKINLGRFVKYSEAVDARKNAEILYGVIK